MTTADVAAVVERVLVAIDQGSAGKEVLAAAVEVAARLGAPVAGLFVEDVSLFRLAELPVARQVTPHARTAVALDAPGLTAALRAVAARAEAALGMAARQRGVPWSFKVVRSDPAAALAQETGGGDLVVVGAATAGGGLAALVHSPLRAAARAGRSTALLLPRHPNLRRPVVVAREASANAERALTTAARLAGQDLAEIDVLCLAAAELIDRLADWAGAMLAPEGYRPRIRRLVAERLGDLLAIKADSDLMMVLADLPDQDEDGAEELSQRLARPLLIVR